MSDIFGVCSLKVTAKSTFHPIKHTCPSIVLRTTSTALLVVLWLALPYSLCLSFDG